MPVAVAGLMRRLAATAIDGVILSPVLFFIGWLAHRVSGLPFLLQQELHLESFFELLLDGGNWIIGLVGLMLVVVLLYGFMFMVTTGSTPGLRLVRLRVINLYGDTPEWWRVLLRCSGFILSVIVLGLGFLWIGFDREKRGLQDWIAGTYVISMTTDKNVFFFSSRRRHTR
jgi:uncharacterized RDD family membrane protein YckC